MVLVFFLKCFNDSKPAVCMTWKGSQPRLHCVKGLDIVLQRPKGLSEVIQMRTNVLALVIIIISNLDSSLPPLMVTGTNTS